MQETCGLRSVDPMGTLYVRSKWSKVYINLTDCGGHKCKLLIFETIRPEPMECILRQLEFRFPNHSFAMGDIDFACPLIDV